jgi:fructokinase
LSLDYKTMTGEALNAHEIAALAGLGDAGAEACMARYERRMAKSLGMVVSILDPAVIVLGGGLSNISRLYDRVSIFWGAFALFDQLSTRLVQAKHGGSSGVRGAARLWPPQGRAQP